MRADLGNRGSNTGEAKGDSYASVENLLGSKYGDVLGGNGGANRLSGAYGNDLLVGRGGNDKLYGGNGNDRLNGGAGADRLDGGAGVDRAEYAGATSKVRADLGNRDTNTGEAKGDSYASVENLLGSKYGDVLAGNGGANGLWGANGNDLLVGRGGNDRLYGGNGNNDLYGGNGNDELFGDKGADLLVGGKGDDDFNFRSRFDSTKGNTDVIEGFDGAGRKGGDRIDVSAIDAVMGRNGNQKFDFDGGKGKGHLWAEDDGRDTMIYGNIDDDRFAEIQIRIEDGNVQADDYFAGDFIL